MSINVREKPSPENHFLRDHVDLLLQSFFQLTGRRLLDPSKRNPAQALFDSSFAVVSHDTSGDPIFNYGNRVALELFEMEWDEFTRLPSRLSAEQPNREERQRLLTEVREKGFIDHYTGIRISSKGRRFFIRDATVWNLLWNGRLLGQAAVFAKWQYLN